MHNANTLRSHSCPLDRLYLEFNLVCALRKNAVAAVPTNAITIAVAAAPHHHCYCNSRPASSDIDISFSFFRVPSVSPLRTCSRVRGAICAAFNVIFQSRSPYCYLRFPLCSFVSAPRRNLCPAREEKRKIQSACELFYD